ncbi:IS4 family transposase [Pontibacter fetidus]|uniref:IS4 family transposase n=1 Tax=Pontibacter fetidus TaxID=2700082 RepID=A0A6B2H5H3_9BACT|nr:IS4 family transposase [Pontibacter fetidus]NDK57741.1 IS4 family transposase [Pontibacter fetidus]
MRKSSEEIIYRVRECFMVDEVEEQYKSRPEDFTRSRILPFKLLVVFMLRRLYKNLALEISEFFKDLAQPQVSLSKSAFTQARQKLSPLFFRNLLHKLHLEFYTDNDERVKQLKSMRLLAVDGSTLDLPFSPELATVYGTHSNQHREARYIKARASVMYDLLNGMVLDGVLQPFAQGEPAAALKHLNYAREGDLLVYDRNYASFQMVYEHRQRGMHVLMRLRSSFSRQVEDFAQSGAVDALVLISPGKNTPLQAYGRDAAIQVRLVKFSLANGETALLLTTLLNKEEFPVELLKQIYAMRWGVETVYDILKNVLRVEYFSGFTQVAIEQDFYISLFLMNLQTLLADELQQELNTRYGHRKLVYKINLATAIGHLKKNVVALFTSNTSQQVLLELKENFLQHVEPVRPNRKYPRQKDKYRHRKTPILMKNRKNVL